jgi:hypothetical protein
MGSVIRLLAGLTATLLIGSLTGCGGSSDKASGTGSDGGTTASAAGVPAGEGDMNGAADITTCRSDAHPAPTPYGKNFPQDWPFPTDAVVFHAEDRGVDGTIVTAVSSLPFSQILDFMNTDVATAGFHRDSGETEARDAEAEWEGNGFHGRWAIKKSADCAGDTVIQVLAAHE